MIAPAPPRPLVAGAAIALGIGTVIMVAGAWRTGVSWDETYHVMRLQNFLDHGWFLLDADLDHGTPGPWVDQRHVYAPVAMLLLHGWSIVLGSDSAGGVSASDQSYAIRHLGVAAIALVGTAAAAVLVRLLLRSWGWAVVAAAVLVAVPTWTGHAMFNVKDIPVATGFTLGTLGVVVVSRRRATTGWIACGLLVTTIGLVFAIGTRPGIWPGIAPAVGLGVLVLVHRGRWWRAGLLAGTATMGVGALVAIYPEAFGNPLPALVAGALESASYGEQPGRRWYLPLYLGIELPTLLLMLGAAGAVVAVRRMVRQDGDHVDDRLLLAVVVLQTFLLPLLAVAKASNLYTGIRQLLFAAPGLAILVTLALAMLWARPRTRGRARRLVPAITAVAIGAPLLVQVQLFPYVYAFSSVPAAVVSPVLAEQDRDLEVQTDYWRTSVRELAPSVPVDGYVTCTPRIDAEERFLPRADESREDCAVDPIGPLAPYDATRAGRAVVAPGHFLAVDAGSAFVGRNCVPVDRVTRRLWWRTVTMSSVSDCELVIADYPPGGVTFDGAGSGADHLRGGWSILRQDPGVGLGGGRSGLIDVTLPADLMGRSLRVEATGVGLAGVDATANGVPTEVAAAGTALWIDVPAQAAAAYGGGRLVLDLTNDESQELRLMSIVVTGAPR